MLGGAGSRSGAGKRTQEPVVSAREEAAAASPERLGRIRPLVAPKKA
jgi:hypothetical protein